MPETNTHTPRALQYTSVFNETSRALSRRACLMLALALVFVAAASFAVRAQPQQSSRRASKRAASAATKNRPGAVEAQTNGNSAHGNEAVRQRRASSPSKEKAEKAAAGQPSADGKAQAATEDKTRAASETKSGTKSGTKSETNATGEDNDVKVEKAKGESDKAAGGAATGEGAEAELEEMRAGMEAEQNRAERTRLERAFVERLVALNRKTEAVAQLRRMLAEERFDPPYFYNVGNQLARLGESGAAIEAYRKAISQRHGNYSRAQHNLGVMLIRLGQWEDAQEALSAALRLESYNYPEASYNLGRLYALRGEAGLAINEWMRALKQQPDHADAAVALARALAEDGDPEGGLAVLDAFSTRLNGRGASAPRSIAIARGEIVAARNLALEDERESASVDKNARMTDSTAMGNPGGATPARYREARTPSSLRPLALDAATYELLRRARAAREAGRNEEAVSLYRRVIQSRGGYFPPANLELGYTLGSLRRNQEAIESFLPLTRRDSARYPIAFYHLGRLYEFLGQFAPAGEAFARAASLYGDANPQFLVDLSRVREKEGKLSEALAAMESYVRASEQMGDSTSWARERVEKLKQKLAAQPAEK